jgi:hypothetical protein
MTFRFGYDPAGLFQESPMYISGFSLLLLILDIYTAYLILTSSARQDRKLLWLVIIFFLPVVGPLLYLILGR